MAKTASTKETPVSTEEETPVRLEGDQWVFLIDPSWQAEAAEKSEGADPEKPPLEAVLGGWFVEESGVTSRFHANPSYEPTTPGSSPASNAHAARYVINRAASSSILASASGCATPW